MEEAGQLLLAFSFYGRRDPSKAIAESRRVKDPHPISQNK